MRKSPDLLGVVESAYATAPTDRDWLQGVANSALHHLDQGLGVVGYQVETGRSDHARFFNYVSSGAVPDLIGVAKRAHARLNGAEGLFARTYRVSGPLNSVRNVIDDETWHLLLGDSPVPMQDNLVLSALDVTGTGAFLAAPMPRSRRRSIGARGTWARIAAHIAAGLRLRHLRASAPTKSDDGEAVLSPAGKVEHATGAACDPYARDKLRSAAVAIDRARGRMRRSEPQESVDLWKGLVQGTWTLVDRFESDGRRYYVAHRNSPVLPVPPLLSDRERQVCAHAALGHSLKLTAYSLGISIGAVSATLCAALRKLRLRRRADLITLITSTAAHDVP